MARQWVYRFTALAMSCILVACSGDGSNGTGGGGSSGSDLRIGDWSWSLPSSGSGTATATGTISNHSSGGKSGSIGLRLRLSTAPYGDGGTYYETARADGLSQLSGGYHRDYTVSDPFSLSSVPSGTYYVVLILAEYTGGSGSGYTIRSGATSTTLYTISGGSGGDGGNGGGGGDSTRYYASCSSCEGPYITYSYSGYDYSTCNAYYQLCVQARCQKILDNCR